MGKRKEKRKKKTRPKEKNSSHSCRHRVERRLVYPTERL